MVATVSLGLGQTATGKCLMTRQSRQEISQTDQGAKPDALQYGGGQRNRIRNKLNCMDVVSLLLHFKVLG
jgi:hypothetical protein